MLKTIITLPDGTVLSSGPEEQNALQSVALTQYVNEGEELEPGAVCAAVLELKLITPGGVLGIVPGQALQVDRVEETGRVYPMGLFTAQTPQRIGPNSYRVQAMDRVAWLDRDLTHWLASLTGWPYPLHTLADMVCRACDLTLVNQDLPNGSYPVEKFSAQGITGRQIMKWIGQIAGCFCRATPAGQVEFAWYEENPQALLLPTDQPGVTVTWEEGLCLTSRHITATEEDGRLALTADCLAATDDGRGNVTLQIGEDPDAICYYGGTLTYADYAVAPVEKVQLQYSREDMGTVWPNIPEAVNTYRLTGNGLLTAADAQALVPVAQTLFERMQTVTYTPCRVTLPASPHIRAGDILTVQDRNGNRFTTWVMRRVQTDRRMELECTGSPRRDSAAAVNTQSYQAITGKVLDLRTDVDGLKVENRDMAGNLAGVSLDLEGIRTAVAAQDGRITAAEQTADGLLLTVGQVADTVDGMVSQGAPKVRTAAKGYTFNDQGLTISDPGDEIENRLDHTGMYVKRAGEIMLRANNTGVLATDVSVRNYLVVGSARFEDYHNGQSGGRTACFYLEEGTYGT